MFLISKININSDFANTSLEVESLILGTNTSSTPTTHSTFNGRKFSDYSLIMFMCGFNEVDIRTQLIIDGTRFMNYINLAEYAPSYYGTSLNQVVFKGIDDTSISIYVSSGTMSYVEIWGVRLNKA